MAQQEVVNSGNNVDWKTVRSVVTRRQVLASVGRFFLAEAVQAPFIEYGRSQGSKISAAESTASSSFPDPSAPSGYPPDFATEADKMNDLYAERKSAAHKDSISDDDPDSDKLKGALKQENKDRVSHLDQEIATLRESPDYKAAVTHYDQIQTDYKSGLAQAAHNRAVETSAIEAKSGVTLPGRILKRIGGTGVLFGLYGSAIFAGVPAALFKRPSWPFKEPEKPQEIMEEIVEPEIERTDSPEEPQDPQS